MSHDAAAHPRKTDSTRDHILAVAMEAFAQHGYDGTSTREICKRAGVNVAALNYHWGSKERLWQAVCAETGKFLIDTLKHSTAEATTIDVLIPSFLEALFDGLVKDPVPIRILLWATLQADSLDFDKTEENFQPFLDLAFATLKQMLQDKGVQNVDVEVVAAIGFGQFVFSFVDQAGYRRFFGKDFKDPAFAERFKRQLIRSSFVMLGLPVPEHYNRATH